MPGIDTGAGAAGLDGLPERLAALLVDATSALEREAAAPAANAEAVARKVGVVARSGAALALFGARLRRREGRPGDPDPTEEADMDDVDDAGPGGAAHDPAFIERGLRYLSRNLGLATADGGGPDGAGPADAGGGDRELGLSGPAPPVAT